MRRLPVYFLIDTSGSMKGEPIEALNNALSAMIYYLGTDKSINNFLWLSVITFDRDIKVLVPLTHISNFELPEIICPKSGPTHTGEALSVLLSSVNHEVRKGSFGQQGDWKPLLYIFTDGIPSDIRKYEEMVPRIKSNVFSLIVACAAGYKEIDLCLKKLTDKVVHLHTVDGIILKSFFEWISYTIERNNKTDSLDQISLPSLPSGINFASMKTA